MKLFDTHCHLQFSDYDDDRDSVIRRALDAGIGMFCVGTDLEMSKAAVELANTYEGMYAAVGLHPNDNVYEGFDADAYGLLVQHPKVIAVGEIGLDYYRTTEKDTQYAQRKRLEAQLVFAEHVKLPVIIHCRNAHHDMYEILKSVSAVQGVIHSFTGTWDDAQRYIDIGFAIGLNGIITFAREYDEAVIHMPVDSILLETDAPFLAPIPYRGKRNEPLYIREIAKQISGLRNIPVEDILSVSRENTLRIFSKVT